MSFVHFLLDLIYPPRCRFCGALLDRESLEPCRKCQAADFWLKEDQAIVPGHHVSRCVCVGWYRDKLRDAVLRFKFQGRKEYAKAYGHQMAKQIRFFLPGAYDVVTWVPVSPETLKKRGYDQAQLLAEAAAAALGQEARPLLAKSRKNRAQSSLKGAGARWKNVAGVYTALHPEALAGQRVLLVDDIFTTGATLEEAAKTLLDAGASQVVAAVLCRTPQKQE